MNLPTTLGLAAATVAASAVVADAALVLEYEFNGTTTSSGTAVDLTLANGAVLGAAGTGVTGAAGDQALDLTDAIGMGNGGDEGAGNGPIATASNVNVLSAGDDFTVAGWYKTSGASIGGDTRLVSYGDGNPFQLLGRSGDLRFATGNGQNFQVGNDLTDDVDTWVFFAATFSEDGLDALVDAGTVELFAGGIDTPVVSLGTSTITLNEQLGSNENFNVGNRDDTRRPFDGFLDNIQVYNEALDLNALEAARAEVIPEPTSIAAFGLMGLLGLRRRR
jgi:hypothetical protein